MALSTPQKLLRKIRSFSRVIGPGVITGAADDDPSGVVTYSQTGASFGYGLLWMSIVSFPFMAIVQEMCARIGMVTGRGLAANLRQFLPRWFIMLCIGALCIANTFNIAADLAAMAAAVQLLIPIPSFLLVCLFASITLALQLFLPYRVYAHYLKWFALFLLAFVFALVAVRIDWHIVLQNTFFPSLVFTKDEVILICAILGTTISPYLFFWETSEEVEELKKHKASNGKQHTLFVHRMLPLMRIDVWIGMLFSNFVMFAIILLTAVTLHSSGNSQVQSIQDVALSLKPLAGNWAFTLFTLGTLGTGMLAIPVLAGGNAYALADHFSWRQGLGKKVHMAPAFYLMIIVSIVVAVCLNLFGLNPVKALVFASMLNGIVAAPLVFLIVFLSHQKKIMGNDASGKILTILGTIVGVVMAVTSIAAIWFSLRP